MQSLNDLWALVLDSLRKTYSETFVTLWFDDLRLEVLNDAYAVLVGSSDFKCAFLKNRHLPAIKEHIENLIGYPVNVVILSEEKGKADLSFYIEGKKAEEEKPSRPRLEIFEEKEDTRDDLMIPASEKFPSYHTEYTFDNFIVGNSNKFVYEACIAVCNSPATNFNPLFIYGQSGLGKTHLLYAINNRMLKKNPDTKILYVRGEDFANQLISMIHNKSSITFRDKFKEKFRTTDILLIDDIHFIAGKESIQEEIFHTFNALYEEGKQLIMTSDRPPREINRLEERIRSRFEGGLIADIQPPDYELRAAIIAHKAEAMGIKLSPDVIDLMAENLRSNIRQIEGAVKKLAAHSFLNGAEITPEFAKECISDLISDNNEKKVTPDKIIDFVSQKYGVSERDIKSKNRTQNIARARHVCIYIIRKMTDLSYPNIGKILQRDSSTVISAYNSIEGQIKESSLLEIEIGELMDEIRRN